MKDSKQDDRLYRVSFINKDKVFEVFAKQIYESDLYGFLAIEEMVFGSQSEIVIDPSEEKLRAEFDGVKRTFIPIHSVVRIDEVRERGTSKITDYEGDGNVAVFPRAAPSGTNDE